MYQNAAILAAFLLIYSAVAGRIERSWLSGPMVFTAAGLLLGPFGLGFVRLNLGAEGLRTLAELTLAMVLFTDAANADFNIVRRNIGIPERLLLIGLPLTIVLGFLAAMVLLPGLAPLEMALIAAILAPTDAALGKPVVTNVAVPAVMREALNIESGLNDGICVPIVVLLLGLAVGTQLEHGTMVHAIRVVAEELGIGLAVGLVLTWLTVRMLHFAAAKGWISEHWEEVPIVALAAACFAATQAIGGSGFIACFVGGLLLSGLRPAHKEELLGGAVGTGEALALLTWVAFGVGALAQIIPRLGWAALAYAVLSLTVIRMVPVVLCLAGTGMRLADKLFVAWFGPRGLATIVFGVIVLNEQLPGNDTIIAVAGFTVLLSVIAHGVSSNPLVRAIAARGGA
jgi:sodium/hydrogen antiporter